MRQALTVLALLLAVCGIARAQGAQTSLTQTSLSAAMDAQTQTAVLASITNVNPIARGQFQSILCIEQECDGVISVNAANNNVALSRGQYGKVGSHTSGAMILVCAAAPNGANPFAAYPECFDHDPPPTGCNPVSGPSQVVVTPWLNMITGNAWLCSNVTLSWVPGFGNTSVPPQPTAAVASAAGLITPSGPLFHITGALAITGFNIPLGFSRGTFCAIPDGPGQFTTTTAGNIALASTAIIGRTICFTWDPVAAKWYPSY